MPIATNPFWEDTIVSIFDAHKVMLSVNSILVHITFQTKTVVQKAI